MIGSRAWWALMRRNLVYRKRNIVGTIFEFCLPIIFVGFLVLIKNSVEDSSGFAPETVPAYFPTDDDVLTPFSFTDYVKTMQATHICQEDPNAPYPFPGRDFSTDSKFSISGVPLQGFHWQVPFVKCDSRRCEEEGDAQPFCQYHALGLAPTSAGDAAGMAQVEAFRDYIYERYPQLEKTQLTHPDDPDAMPFDFEFVKIFKSDMEIEDYVSSDDYLPKLAMAVVFDGTDPEINYNYKIRVNSTNFNAPEDEGRPATSTTPPTNTLVESYAVDDDGTCPLLDGTAFLGPYQSSCTGQYIYNGAVVMQRLIGDFIMEDSGARAAGYFVSEHGVKYAPFPSKEYEENGFYAAIAAFAPLLITLGLLYPVAAMIRYITLEKELRQKELMKMMSVTESDIGWSWFMSFFMLHFFTATGAAMVTTSLYSNSEPFLIWIFWVFTLLSIICFCFFLASLFSKSTRATLVSLLIFFIGYFLTLVVDYQESSIGTIGLVALHPVGAFAFGLQEIGRLEDLGIGLTGDTVSTTDSPSGYTFANTISNHIFDCILWGVASWYLNRVIPSDFGRPLPWYFPFSLSYWCPGSGSNPPSDDTDDEVTYEGGVTVEPVSNALKGQTKEGKGIEIRKLRKTFGDKTAVDGLSLSMYNGQITALLGHNGAGKTTTISMLTGMIAPTEGHAIVAGKDIRTGMNEIRQEIGICLQHDCLFPELTVREHVQFFARLKGMYSRMSHQEAEEKVDISIQDVALAEKRNTLSKSLSGGMKRKLSVAIAFCGDSKTVLLDEPTSGMDPFSRRFTWNVIRQYRQDRCIILTTHFMDEADILGDRIAIMSEGQLRCVGSSLFLKKTYGVGYQLTIEKHPHGKENKTIVAAIKKAATAEGEGMEIGEDDDQGLKSDLETVDETLSNIVTGAVTDATLLSSVGTELSFQLPLGAASNFTQMFGQLDDQIESGGIVTYGVGITTLDEVFLLVARGDSTAESKKSFRSSVRQESGAPTLDYDPDKSVRSRMDLENEGLFTRHVAGLFRKRAVIFKRDKKAWCCTTILPTMFVLSGFLLFAFASPKRNLDPITLDINELNKNVAIEPRNPVNFNKPGSEYACNPGKCIYDIPYIDNRETGEIYSFCGLSISFANNLTCTIQDSETLLSGMTEAVPVGDDSTNSLETSYALADSSTAYAATQYGGIYFLRDTSSMTNFDGSTPFEDAAVITCLTFSGDYMNMDECSNYGGIAYTIRYNFTAVHAAPMYQTLADEAIVREALKDEGFKIRTTLHPLPLTQFEEKLGQAEDAFSFWFLTVLSFPFISGSFATFVVAERQSKAKHLQTVAGVKPSAYWLSTWLWDVVNYMIPCWITVILMFAFDVDVLTKSEDGLFGGILCLLILYGPASASFTYCVSFLFSSPSICNLILIISGFLIGLGGSMACFILRLIGANPATPKDHLVLAANITEWVLRFIPAFSLSKGLFNAINIQTFQFLEAEKITVWHERILLWEVIFMAWQSIGYLLLAMKIDEWSANPQAVSMWRSFVSVVTFQFLCPVIYMDDGAQETPDDSDVLAEQQRVLSGGANNDLIVLSQLSKVFDNGKRAVKNMTMGIPPGQCFGLLGINGAGKTTTMGMLTAEFPPSSGDATLAGFSVTHEPEKTRRRVGYCPQFDAHFADMTGREHVELYASIKGVPIDLVQEAGAQKLAEVGLSPEDSDRLSAGYSGGMKRRLSLACATIGQPQIVFLDECSTGVDPVARREIWQMISDMVTGGNLPPEERPSVILTTHSMEECEALCPNIGIMAGGKLRCLGSAQHLKSKFGQGFQVEMKIKTIEKSDSDYLANFAKIAEAAGISATPAENEEGGSEAYLDLEKAKQALRSLTGDEYLSSMIVENNSQAYIVFRDASSPTGVELHELTNFATSELRMRGLNEFVAEAYPNSLIRERQDQKARYEVSNEGVKIANIFASIEENKERLLVAEYGVSQTSLEQVFNMHAAAAEKLKYGTNDG